MEMWNRHLGLHLVYCDLDWRHRFGRTREDLKRDLHDVAYMWNIEKPSKELKTKLRNNPRKLTIEPSLRYGSRKGKSKVGGSPMDRGGQLWLFGGIKKKKL